MESIEPCIIKVAAMGNQADRLFFTHRNTGPSACTVKATWNMIIAAVAIILVVHMVDIDNSAHYSENSGYIGSS